MKDLACIVSSSVRFQSAFIRRVAENRNQHCPCCSHAIVADSVGIALKSQLDMIVAKQSLYRFRISPDADEERCQAVTQIVEAESPRVGEFCAARTMSSSGRWYCMAVLSIGGIVKGGTCRPDPLSIPTAVLGGLARVAVAQAAEAEDRATACNLMPSSICASDDGSSMAPLPLQRHAETQHGTIYDARYQKSTTNRKAST